MLSRSEGVRLLETSESKGRPSPWVAAAASALAWLAVHTTTLPASAQAGPGAVLQVTLLGTGNPRPSMERFGPSILIEAGERRILIDAGRGATQRLFAIGQRNALISVDLLLLTHLHSDHVVGLPDLWLTAWLFGRSRPLDIAGPRGTVDLCRHLEEAYQFDVRVRRADEGLPAQGAALAARDVDPGVVYERDGLVVRAFVVDHGGGVEPAYGYRIDYRGRSVAFSGDTRQFEPLVEHARGVDVLVHEVVSPEVELRRAQVADPRAVERIVAHHASPEQAGAIFAKVKPRLAVYSHIVPSPATEEDLVGPTRKSYDGPLVVGYDLMTILIGDSVEVRTRETVADKEH